MWKGTHLSIEVLTAHNAEEKLCHEVKETAWIDFWQDCCKTQIWVKLQTNSAALKIFKITVASINLQWEVWSCQKSTFRTFRLWGSRFIDQTCKLCPVGLTSFQWCWGKKIKIRVNSHFFLPVCRVERQASHLPLSQLGPLSHCHWGHLVGHLKEKNTDGYLLCTYLRKRFNVKILWGNVVGNHAV